MWYRKMGSFLTMQWVETQFSYQDNLQNVVCLVYDPVLTSDGTLSLKAYRLSTSFMELRKRGDFSSLGFSRARIDSSQMIEELPVHMTMSSVQKAFVAELACQKEFSGENKVDFARLRLPEGPSIQQTMEYMINDLEELNREQNKYSYFLRSNNARIQGTYQELLRKKRTSKGEPQKIPNSRKRAHLALVPRTTQVNPTPPLFFLFSFPRNEPTHRACCVWHTSHFNGSERPIR